MPNKREIIYNWKWQVTRISCCFTDEKKAIESLQKLRTYINVSPGPGDSEANRIYRVLNLLTAAHMGLQGQIQQRYDNLNPAGDLRAISYAVLVERDVIRKLTPNDRFVFQTREQQRQELEEGFRCEGGYFQVILEDLERRFRRAKTETSRPELESYINLMKEVQHASRPGK